MTDPDTALHNEALQRLDGLVGDWALVLSDAWFLEPAGTELHGSATIEWLEDAFLVYRSVVDDHPSYELVIGHSDPNDAYVALYHDERGTSRLFDMTFEQDRWTLDRRDPDFHQRFIADVSPNRIAGRWEASEDEGRTWRKDYDLTLERPPRA